jgi:CHAT domain-containing protein/tetratricopeptide (TPR) repeat protein
MLRPILSRCLCSVLLATFTSSVLLSSVFCTAAVAQSQAGPPVADRMHCAASDERLLAAVRERSEQALKAQVIREGSGASSPEYGAAAQALGRSLYGEANLNREMGCYTQAVVALEQMLDIMAPLVPKGHPLVVRIEVETAGLLVELGRSGEAEVRYGRARAAVANQPDKQARLLLARIENDLAELHVRANRFEAARAGFATALAINEAELPPDAIDTAKNLSNLGDAYARMGAHHLAEPLFGRALQMMEAKLGLEHPDVATVLNNLASVHRNQGLLSKALPLFERALAIRRARLDAGHPDLAQSYNNLGWLYQNLAERASEAGEAAEAARQLDRAATLFDEALVGLESRLGPEHARVGMIKNNLAVVQFGQRRYAEAEALFKAAIDVRGGQLGAEHPDVAQSMHRLARVLHAKGQYRDALKMHRGALDIRVRALRADHPDVAQSWTDMAQTAGALGRWRQATEYVRKAREIVIERARRGMELNEAGADERGRQELASRREVFEGHVRTLWAFSEREPERLAEFRAEAFETAHYAGQTAAEAALAQMSVRQARGAGPLAALIRERQDVVREWQTVERQLQAAIASAAGQRSAVMEEEWRGRLAQLDSKRIAIDARLQATDPEYRGLAQSDPLSLEEARALLGSGEALIQFMFTAEDGYAWVVTEEGTAWVRIDLSIGALGREVAALRCGLDETAWSGSACPGLTGRSYGPEDRAAGRLLPFDTLRSHRLYAALFGKLGRQIAGKSLIVVPAAGLTRLPLQALVTRRPAAPGAVGARWLIRDHALTVLPAASSLRALRRVTRPSVASRAFTGFGNPLLDGDPSDTPNGRRERQLADLARRRESCEDGGTAPLQQVRTAARAALPIRPRGGSVETASLRIQLPLPETADELCAVGRELKAAASEIRLGARASEGVVKAMSDSGELARFRILHFATHGTLAGQLEGALEPGLILTPPATANDDDDGYLTASEIAGLKLDADWVILSACNTAGGSGVGSGSEALSGLARAFFYAGARALLVSHWEVDSAATVKLVTTTMRALGADTRLGRAEALRRAMLAMIDGGNARQAHPAAWAPFVVVGEGRI